MPYFSWQGVDLFGKRRRGKMFALSAEKLDNQLFKRDIALLKGNQAKLWFLSAITFNNKIIFFEQLAALLDAGILVPEALNVLINRLPNVRMQLMVEHIANDIQQGNCLSNALHKYPRLFDRMMIHMIRVGQEAGKLPASVSALVVYLTSLQEFRKKVRAASMMPLISLLFFIGIALLIVLVMLPRLVEIVGSAQHQLPAATRALLCVGMALQGWLALAIGVGIIGLFVAIRTWLSRPKGKIFWDSISLRIPLINDIVISSQMGWFLSSAALLVRNGVAAVPALSIAKETVRNTLLQKNIETIIARISAGSLMYDAMIVADDRYFWPEVVAIINVGEQSGRLAEALDRGAKQYHTRAMGSLQFIATIVQPLMLIILGLMIAFLIIAVYAPLFTLSATLG